MPSSIAQRQRVLVALTPRDITAQATGPYLDVSGCQRMMLAVNAGTVAATKTITVQAMQAQDAAGTGAKALGSPVVVAAPAGGGALAPTVDIKIGALDHNNGFGFVAAQLVSNNATAVYAGATLILSGNRYNP